MPSALPPTTDVEADRYVREPDLSDLTGFWTESIEHRHRSFNTLRELPGLPFFSEPTLWNQNPGPGYYALTEAGRADGQRGQGRQVDRG